MQSFLQRSICFLAGFGLCVGAFLAQAQDPAKGAATIRRLSLLAGSSLELEIAASGPIAPRAQVIQGPDRLVIDFPNTVPAKGLHNLDINRGEVKDARIGLFASDPPVTRVVLDLKSPQPYQLFPSGNTVVVKFGGNLASLPAAIQPETIITIQRPGGEESVVGDIPSTPPPIVEQSRAVAVAPKPPPPVEVRFENGLLSIRSSKANLSEVLAEVHRRTGAEIAIPAGAEAEQVFTDLGPGKPKEVLASLLNGSHFNFIVIGSERDPGGIRRVVLTPKQGGAPEAVIYPCGATQPAMAQATEPASVGQAFPPVTVPDEPDLNDTPTQPMPEPQQNGPQQ
jgi:hypothetical protein